MTVRDIVEIIGAEIICREDLLDTTVERAFGSDMMSDVLAFVKEQAVLLTGLVNPQVIRTASMMDIVCVVFVRSKNPSLDMIELARECDIVIMKSAKRAYEACGMLYSGGLNTPDSED